MKYDEMDKKIGSVLKRYREKKGLSLRAVGEILNVNNSTIIKWESGINSIVAKDLLHYLDLLGFTYEQFIDDLKGCDE